MKYLKVIIVILFAASGCKKEDTLPRLSFSAKEKNWFIYHPGQQFKFKSSTGDSVIFVVDSIRNYFAPEYKDPFTNSIKIDDAEFYVAYLTAKDDFINITFYKSSQYTSDENKLNQTILWRRVAGQFVEIENIKNQAPFTSTIIRNVTYSKVSPAIPMSYMQYPWTKWNTAYYDQNYGFIELIDTNGVSWTRQ